MLHLPRSARAAQPASAASPWAWALAGALVGLLLALVLGAPARWLSGAVQQATQGQLQLQDAQGTLWDGSARLVLTGGHGSPDAATLPGRLTWQWRPDWSGLSINLYADCCMQQAWRLSLQPRWDGAQLTLADSQSQWPAQWLTGLGTPWNTLQLEGALGLSTQNLVITSSNGHLLMAGALQLDALHMASRLSTLKPLGSYRVSITGGDTAALQLQTLAGSRLQLNGTGQWVGARLRFDGTASATQEHLDALSNLLNIIGRRDGPRAILKVG